jgi:3-oxosteroid 1-dehydrogenase
MIAQNEDFDFIIVGSGGGSIPAALVMKQAGKRPLILEKQALIGGTSALSGGMLWIPNNDHLQAVGGGDTVERAREYMDKLIGNPGPASTPARREAYIRNAVEMIRFLEKRGMKFRHAGWPDYYDERPGGIGEGRSIVPRVFDFNQLGAWKDKLGRHPHTGRLPTNGPELAPVQAGGWRRYVILAKIGWRMAQNKYLGRDIRGFGQSLMGRLIKIALDAEVPIWPETPVKDFLVENGRVVGVIAERDGKPIELRASLGVLVNAGGFARNRAMRERYQPKPTSTEWTQVNPGDTGEMIEAAERIGAALDQMDEAFWFPCSFYPDGTLGGMHSSDIAKPHCIVVDSTGRRFASEAVSHMELGKRMYESGTVPAWAVFDNNHRQRYTWGMLPPVLHPTQAIESGYLKTGRTLEELAAVCGINPSGLRATVERFNSFVRQGVDEDFHRGESVYQQKAGDLRVKPNSTLGEIKDGPFYAAALWPADVGTCGGIVTDEHARALRPDGSVIQGLYATGNSTATVMGRVYPGGGVSIGPSMTFGYIAARNAARVNA